VRPARRRNEHRHPALARATARRQEFAVRAALGGTRWQVARVVVAEMLTLAAGGGLLGLALAWAAVRVLGAAGPHDLPASSS
jgi:ABC-type antimicrobial peptide transport system permease subunit